MKEKTKRLLAWAGVLLLVLLYLTTLLLALSGQGFSSGLFAFFLLADILVPIFLWVVFRIIWKK